jgi:general secretion pathway protein D
MVPHVVRSQSIDPVNLRTIDTGAGQQTVELRHVPAEAPASTPQITAPPPRPDPSPRSSVGTVPGQTAQAAGPAALAQLRDAAYPAFAAQPAAPPLPAAAAPIALAMSPLSGPIAAGTTFQVPIVLSHGVDIASVPLQLRYDPAQLSLVNLVAGDFLSRDGQAVGLVHREDPPGSLTINASRPPGVAGVSGSGTVYVLSFQAKAAGTSAVDIVRPAALNSAQQQLPVQGARISVQVK